MKQRTMIQGLQTARSHNGAYQKFLMPWISLFFLPLPVVPFMHGGVQATPMQVHRWDLAVRACHE